MRRARVDLLKQAFIHGCFVDSAVPFRHRELSEHPGTPDLFVVEGAIAPEPGSERAWSSPVAGVARCDLPFGRILVEGGERITVDTPDWPTLRPWVVGTAFAIAAQQRGRLVLHASTVEIGGVAIAFAAPSGVGKSTLIATLIAQGARLVAEDVTAVDTVAWPGPRRLRLNPDAVHHLGLEGLDVEASSPAEPAPKLGWSPPSVDEPLPLGAIVLLGPVAADAPPRLRRSPPHLAWGSLVTNSYTLRLLHVGERIDHLQGCVDIGRKASVFEADIPRSLPRLSEIATWIRTELAAQGVPAGLVGPADRR